MMKVLHVITSLNVGGAERSLVSVIRSVNSGTLHGVLSLGEVGPIGEQLRSMGIPVIPMNLHNAPAALCNIPKLRKFALNFRPNIIQGWMYHGNVAAWLTAKLLPTRIPVLANVRHSLYDIRQEKSRTQMFVRANRTLSERMNGTIYNSALSRTQHEHFGFGGYSEVISNGFDLSRWAPNPECKRSLRTTLGLSDNRDRLVGHFARYHPMKDHDTFLRAAVIVLANMPGVHFLLAGMRVDATNENLVRLIPQEFRHRVHLLGERNDIERLMPALDVFCLSSWSEAFPNVVGEAMACGVPCVTTDVGDCKEIVGSAGHVVPPRRWDLLADALMKTLNECPGGVEYVDTAARARVETYFSVSAMSKGYSRLYERCILGMTKS